MGVAKIQVIDNNGEIDLKITGFGENENPAFAQINSAASVAAMTSVHDAMHSLLCPQLTPSPTDLLHPY